MSNKALVLEKNQTVEGGRAGKWVIALYLTTMESSWLGAMYTGPGGAG